MANLHGRWFRVLLGNILRIPLRCLSGFQFTPGLIVPADIIITEKFSLKKEVVDALNV